MQLCARCRSFWVDISNARETRRKGVEMEEDFEGSLHDVPEDPAADDVDSDGARKTQSGSEPHPTNLFRNSTLNLDHKT